MVADKKRMNQEAIAEIQQVNSEVAGNLGSLSRDPKIETGRKSSEQIKNVELSRDYVATSLFNWRQQRRTAEKPKGKPQGESEGKLSQLGEPQPSIKAQLRDQKK